MHPTRHRTVRPPLYRLAASLITFALVATACRRPEPEVELGVQRIALSLSFSEEELKEPIEPEVIIKVIPAPPPDVVEPVDIIRYTAPPPEAPVVFDFTPPCPELEPGAAPDEPVVHGIHRVPDEGVFTRFNAGFIDIDGGLITLKFPFPPISTWTIRHVEPNIPALSPDVPEPQWEIRKQHAPGFVITDTWRLTNDDLRLTKRVTDINGDISTFTPTPGIEFYRFGNSQGDPGDSWTSAGVDTSTNTAMVGSFLITKRELVNACGVPVDAFAIEVEEQIVNLETGETSGTNAGEPNIYHVATHFGGVFVQEDIHMITNTTTDDNVPVTIGLDYVSVFNTLDREPLPPPEPEPEA